MKAAIKIAQARHLPDDIADQLRLALFSRQYLPGDRLPAERLLAKTLNVHRASLREALKRLEAQGLLRIRQGDGIYVRDFLTEANVSVLEAYLFSRQGQNRENLRSIQEFRLLIQCDMSRLAALRRNSDEIAALTTLVTAEATASEAAEFRALDWEFFQTIARASHNIVFTFLLNSVRPIHERWGALYFNLPGTLDTTRRFHRLIAWAITKADPARAASVTRKLLEYSNPILIDEIPKILGDFP